ncbi:MAG: FtsH protease activity modulator HflK [Acidobacteria bacterium]|nr:MAG: FtsH protease activity modulator HflK [Acidobacteriota bacterium]
MDRNPDWPRPPEVTLPPVPRVKASWVVWAAVALALLVALSQSVYQVQPEEEAIVLRFGKWTGEVHEPGLNFKIPFVDRVYKLPTQRQLKEEFGFRTRRPGVRTEYEKKGYEHESLMLTGDLNVADVEWVVQYKIRDPYKFLFKVRDPVTTFRDMSEAVMRQVVGDRSVDEVLTIGRAEVASEARRLLQELCDRYEIGISVEQLVLQDVNPPDPVKPSFNKVNEALQERERLVNQAWAEYNRAVPKARGEAEEQIRRAEGYALERVNNAKGEAARFLSVYEEYRKAPEVTRTRLYLETVEELLPRLGDKVVIDGNLPNLVPLLGLHGEALAARPAEGGR